MSYNTTIIEKIFRGNTMAVFANPPLPPLNGPLCDSVATARGVTRVFRDQTDDQMWR